MKNRNPDGSLIHPSQCGIYQVRCLVDNKVLVGQTTFFHTRWLQHRRDLRNKKHYNRHFQFAYDKHGEENFVYEVVECCDIDKLDERECYWMVEKNSRDSKHGYNAIAGGRSVRGNRSYQFGKKMPPEFGRAISEAKKRNPIKGEDHPLYGVQKTEKHRLAIKEAHNTPEYLAKLQIHVDTFCKTPEFKQKMKECNKKRMRAVHQIDLETKEIINTYECISDAARTVGTCVGSICSACAGKSKQINGFGWKYAD